MPRHKNKQQPDLSINTTQMLDVFHTGAQQAPKRVASYLEIPLPVAEPAKPDPSRPLTWFDAYERFNPK